eukprot:4332689-Pleurochrysis_carterae.AAC.1
MAASLGCHHGGKAVVSCADSRIAYGTADIVCCGTTHLSSALPAELEQANRKIRNSSPELAMLLSLAVYVSE